ncbi:MAG: hypothetical protein ACRDY2_13355 [Acidimicrobiales bacterium]
MAARRPFGTVRERGGRFQARYQAPDGTEHVFTFTTKAEAGRWLAAAQTDRERGAWVDPRQGRVSLANYATTWLDRRTDLRPTTHGKYADLLRLHVVPKLGKVELGKLAPSTVRSWYLDLRGRHAVTSDDAYRLLRTILNTAVADEVIVVNPCKVKGAGQVRSPERPTATVAELAGAVEVCPSATERPWPWPPGASYDEARYWGFNAATWTCSTARSGSSEPGPGAGRQAGHRDAQDGERHPNAHDPRQRRRRAPPIAGALAALATPAPVVPIHSEKVPAVRETPPFPYISRTSEASTPT